MARSFEGRLGFLGACGATGAVLAIMAYAALPAAPSGQSRPVSGTDLASASHPNPAAGASATPSGATRTTYGPLAWYTNEEDGYEMLMPEAWAEGASPIYSRGEPYEGVRKFGHAGNSLGYQGLTISVGQPDGSVRANCEVASCQAIHAESMDELAEALTSNSKYAPESWNEAHGDLSLGGEPGRWERAANRNSCLGCPWAMYHVFTIHDGRPVVLAFDNWNLRFNRLALNTTALVTQMVASFRFVDELMASSPAPPEPSQLAYRTISWTEAGIEFDVPVSWELRPVDDPLLLSVGGQGGRLTIRVGDMDGRILDCGDGPGSPCTAVSVQSSDDLADLVAPANSNYWGSGATRVSTRVIDFGGEMARRVIVERWPGREYGGRVRYYVVAFHDGRPLIMAWAPTGGGGPIFRGIRDSFRFLD